MLKKNTNNAVCKPGTILETHALGLLPNQPPVLRASNRL